MSNTTITNKPSVNDTTINYNLKVGTVKAQPKQAKQGEHVSNLSVADQIWQGTKSGLKMSAWTGSSAVAGMFTTELRTSTDRALGPNMIIGAAPIAVGFVSGAVTGIANNVFGAHIDDKVGKTMKELGGGPWTPANAAFKAGVVVNGLAMPSFANEAAMAANKLSGRLVRTTALGAVHVGTGVGAAVLGAKFAKGSASTGGAVFAGAAGGAVAGAAGGALLEVGRKAFASSAKHADIKGALIAGAFYGAAYGIGGALIQKFTRKAG